jgi:acetyltransferase-like isoleucine patch superfamily enzyme
MFKTILIFIYFIMRLPSRILKKIQKKLITERFSELGKNFIFDPASSILTPDFIKVGDNVSIGEQAHISAKVKIGNNVIFGPRPIIIGGDHYFAVKGKSIRFLHPKADESWEPILIEDEVWCGASVIILGNVTIGMGCVIGAGSVVVKNIPPYVVAVGNYCKPVKKIFDDKTLFDHLINLGKNNTFATEIIKRRKEELNVWKLNNLESIEKTSSYWETQDRNQPSINEI